MARFPKQNSSGHTIGSHHGIAVCHPLVEVNNSTKTCGGQHGSRAGVIARPRRRAARRQREGGGHGRGSRCHHRAATARHRGGDEDTDSDSDGGGTDNNQQSTKVSISQTECNCISHLKSWTKHNLNDFAPTNISLIRLCPRPPDPITVGKLRVSAFSMCY